jgi:catechol-2,3-dioxygenase
MKRMHIHLSTGNLKEAEDFYSALFGTAPTVRKTDYLKWSLDDPAVNLAISAGHAGEPGIDHLGIETDDDAGLETVRERLQAAAVATADQTATNCCYAVSDKSWTLDPHGVRWEVFRTHAMADTYGEDASPSLLAPAPARASGTCC